jgi:secondary thiamine-phosphate synthase enzyme
MNIKTLENQPAGVITTTAWKVATYRLVLESRKAPEFIDITEQVERFVERSQVLAGIVVVFSRHTTAAIRVNENEPLLLNDLEGYLERLAPRSGEYHHNDFTVRTVNMNDDECPNGHAHCQHLLLGTSETIPIIGGQIQLGRWQRIFMIELDRPKQREVLVQVMGA